jgi:ribonucleotide reductase beta subunit family protein with ferritin-like domain
MNRDPEVVRERMSQMRDEMIDTIAKQETQDLFERLDTADKGMIADALSSFVETISDSDIHNIGDPDKYAEVGRTACRYVNQYVFDIKRQEIEQDYDSIYGEV